MILAAGIVLIVDNKILFCHPTNSAWTETYSIPKGLVDEGEDIKTAALRECKEEAGIDLITLMPNLILEEGGVIDYLKKKEVFKQVHYFIVRTTLEQLGLNEYVLPTSMLQLVEVDWGGFITKEEGKEKVFWRQKQILDLL